MDTYPVQLALVVAGARATAQGRPVARKVVGLAEEESE